MHRAAAFFSHGRNKISSLPKWFIGVAISTPVAAVFQGAALLQDFRNNHLDAPIPLSPSRGIVVMKSTDSRTKSKENEISLESRRISNTSESSEEIRPLRLLVIGDSLAAGVGVLKQSTPILPESIAKALSQANGGRAISWTCVGNPGASSSQIVKDILSFKEDSKNDLMERKFREWQTTKQKAQEWLRHRQEEDEEFEDNAENSKRSAAMATAQQIKTWWRRVRHDVRSFHQHVIQKSDALPETVENHIANRTNSNGQLTLANEYDIAIVLTGLNDLKEAWLPFMMNSSLPSHNDDSSIKDRLLKVLHALTQRMNLDLPHHNCTTSIEDERSDVNATLANKQLNRCGPIVVFPAIPAAPTHPLFHYWPLSWFAVPLLRAVDNHKRRIAQRFPHSVLYVEQPSTSSVEDMEAGRGPIFDKRKAEEVLLSLTDATKKAKEKVEKLMRQYDERWTKDSEGHSQRDSKSPLDSPDHHYEGCVEPYNVQTNWLNQRNAKEAGTGSTLMALDKVHPNDEGYDFWGRHIAAAIVAELEGKADTL